MFLRTFGGRRPPTTTTGDDRKDCLCFIEVVAHKDDTSKELLEWGSRVSAANSRPPNLQ
jgi:pyruvate decarboxylase